jgi:predicted amidohydrolase
LAQVDSQLGDLDANARRARDMVSEARAGGADLVVFPELQLSGYALGRTERETACSPAEAAEPADGMAALIGFNERDGDRRYNSAMYVEDGLPLHVHRKLYLAGYAPFEEDRLFEPGRRCARSTPRSGAWPSSSATTRGSLSCPRLPCTTAPRSCSCRPAARLR